MIKSIDIIAILDTEATGIFRLDGMLYLLRPPYDVRSRILISERDLFLLVDNFGFDASPMQTFPNWPEAVKFLRAQFQLTQSGSSPTSEEMSKSQLILKLPKQEAQLALEGLREELRAPDKLRYTSLEEIEDALLEMLNVDHLNEDSNIVRLIAEILRVISNLRKSFSIGYQIDGHVSSEKWTPYSHLQTKEDPSRVLKTIHQNGSTLAWNGTAATQ